MSALRNRVKLIGRLGHDPVLVTLENKKKVTNLRVATNETYLNSEGKKVEKVQWHSIVAWGKKAEIIVQYLSKGEEFALEGKLVYRPYTTDEGEKRTNTEIELSDFLFLGQKKATA